MVASPIFIIFRVIIAFSSLGHNGSIFMIKLSKITIEVKKMSILLYLLRSTICFKHRIHVLYILQNVKMELLRTGYDLFRNVFTVLYGSYAYFLKVRELLIRNVPTYCHVFRSVTVDGVWILEWIY
jgi:hypothetical protein